MMNLEVWAVRQSAFTLAGRVRRVRVRRKAIVGRGGCGVKLWSKCCYAEGWRDRSKVLETPDPITRFLEDDNSHIVEKVITETSKLKRIVLIQFLIQYDSSRHCEEELIQK